MRGEAVVEVKAGDAITDLTESWMVEKFVPLVKKEEKKTNKNKGNYILDKRKHSC